MENRLLLNFDSTNPCAYKLICSCCHCNSTAHYNFPVPYALITFLKHVSCSYVHISSLSHVFSTESNFIFKKCMLPSLNGLTICTLISRNSISESPSSSFLSLYGIYICVSLDALQCQCLSTKHMYTTF